MFFLIKKASEGIALISKFTSKILALESKESLFIKEDKQPLNAA